ncbi:MAG: transcription antitermination factor NusB [Treponema sp.]|jgi:N utilization substance protein B|nr:transcription antitermination factor NusB [Treponema sp.]
MGSRRKGRILAFQALYAWGMSEPAAREKALPDLLEFLWLERPRGETADFSRLLLQGAVENIEPVDELIKRQLVHWDFSRVNRVDQAILRLGVYEMAFQKETPAVVINEAVNISKEFGNDDSYRFVNGVLDGVRKSLLEPVETTKGPS